MVSRFFMNPVSGNVTIMKADKAPLIKTILFTIMKPLMKRINRQVQVSMN